MHMIAPYRRRRHPSSLGFPMAPLMSSQMDGFNASSLMKTDISKTDEGYELTMELPGFAKEGVQAEFKDGYLTVSASMEEASEQKPEASENAETETAQESSQQTWVRRERFFGSCQRSFYLGEDINEEAISATFENGLLKVSVPQLAEEPEAEKKTVISIEG